ncbi:hypothetical protein EU538_05715 [Candidatus Thorarchaeota archaeon]|nr:MAG: hypothetical protein EU538_05715 [Candidatus Thorarchaeota archaeon]
MQLKEHKDDLADRIELLDASADSELAAEIISLYEEKCAACQEDRLSCTVRPSCKDRNFLNMLIELGVESQDLPQFCYSQYLDQIRRYILERKGRRMNDRRLPIKDLLSTLRMSSIRQFTSRFSKIWKKMARIRANDLFLVMGDDLLFQFNFARGIVILNPSKYVIPDYDTFRMYVDLFQRYYELVAEVTDLTTNWWELDISAGAVPPSNIEKVLGEKQRSRFESYVVTSSEENTHLILETTKEKPRSSVTVGLLAIVFEKVSGLVLQGSSE